MPELALGAQTLVLVQAKLVLCGSGDIESQGPDSTRPLPTHSECLYGKSEVQVTSYNSCQTKTVTQGIV